MGGREREGSGDKQRRGGEEERDREVGGGGGGNILTIIANLFNSTKPYHSLSLPPLSDSVLMFFVDSCRLFWRYSITARLHL